MNNKTLTKTLLATILAILIASFIIFNWTNKRYNNNINELNIQITILNDSINSLKYENSRIEKRITKYTDSIKVLNSLVDEQEEEYIDIITDLENEVEEIQLLTPVESVNLLSNNLSQELSDSITLRLRSDSTTNINIPQTKVINIVFAERNNQLERIETLTNIIITKDGIINLQDKTIIYKNLQIFNLNVELKIKDQIIDIIDKKHRKELRNAKLKWGIGGTFTGALLIVILL